MPTAGAVLFDMDGVLVDSFDMWLHAMNDAAVELRCPPISRAQLEAAFGQGVEEDTRTFFAGCTRERLAAAYEAAIPGHTRRIRPNPEAPTVLAALARRGIARAVVTNTTADAVPGILAACGLEGLVDVVLGVRPGIAEKPAPDLLLAACRALATAPADALMVGDSAYDRAAAAAAGIAYLHYDLRRGDALAPALEQALEHR